MLAASGLAGFLLTALHVMQGFDDLFRDADALAAPVPVAVMGAADRTVLAALRAACDRGWIVPLAVGRAAEVRRVAAESGLDLAGFHLLDSTAADAAVGEVRSGRARLLMKGQVATPELMRAILDEARGLRTGSTVCQVVLLEVGGSAAGGRRQFLLADTGVCIQPTLAQKEDILRQSVAVAHALGAETARVALLAATETINPAMPETLEAAELVRRAAAGRYPGCHVQGPLSFDLAFSSDAGEKKRCSGPVVGAADVLLFPNLLSANLTVKAIMHTAPCRFGGVLCGAACPVVFMSRSDTPETRLHSLALALRLLPAAGPDPQGQEREVQA